MISHILKIEFRYFIQILNLEKKIHDFKSYGVSYPAYTDVASFHIKLNSFYV